MLKIISIILAIASSFSVYANCEISEALKNKVCSSDYFTARNSKQLNEYLQYGVYKQGKLLNLEIGFNLKEKEINLGTTCDLRINHEVDIRASLNGICLQAKNIYILKHSNFFADKKAPINLIANDSIKIRKSNLKTSGDVNLTTLSFDPFSNEILISRDTQISAEKLNMSTPSSLIINDESKIKSTIIVLNGGNCEIGDGDDQDDDQHRNREKQCKKFKPKFNFSGSCLNNPIPTTLKISSVVDSVDSQKLTYSVAESPTGSTVKWKFDDEFVSSNANAVQSFMFPGNHLAEAVVSTPDGYFRKLGAYNNVSPKKLNKGQMAIFQFSGIHYGPAKVMGISGLKKFTLVRSEQDPRLYIGEIPADTAGTKMISIPEFKYSGNFNLVVLPAISDPDAYINQSVEQLNTLLDSVNSTNQTYINYKSSLQSLLNELKEKISGLPASDKQKIAEYLQANIFADLQGITSFKQIKSRPSTLFGLLIASAYAQDSGIILSNDIISGAQLRQAVLILTGLMGAGFIIAGGFNLKTSPFWGTISIAAGFLLLFKVATASEDIITGIHNIAPNSLNLKLPSQINSGIPATFTIWGQAVPLDSIAPTSPLIAQSIDAKNNANTQLEKINSQVNSINSNLELLGLSSQIEPLPLLTFPQTRFRTILSPNYVTKVQLISSDDGQASVQSYSMDGNNLLITFKSLKTQNAKLRVTFVNAEFGINKNIDTDIVITAAPKAIINYTKTGLKVTFNSTDPSDPDVTGLKYFWDFGDGVQKTVTAKEVTHLYNESGTYSVTLAVKDEAGNFYKAYRDISVTQPVLSSQFDVTKSGMKATFTALNYNPTFSYVWDFGDGQVVESSGAIVEHQYLTAGFYEATLTVVAPNGNQVSNTKFLVLAQDQIYKTNVSDYTVNFNVLDEFNLSGTNFQFVWDFNDGTVLKTQDLNVSHTYQDLNPRNVILKIVSPDGVVKYKTTIMVPDRNNLALFDYSYAGRVITFSVFEYYDVSNTDRQYYWEFGDGTTLVTKNLITTHSYPDLTSREVKLKIKDSNGLVVYQSVINLPDRTKSSINIYQVNRKAKFTLISSIGGTNTDYTFSWDFGDGNSMDTNSDFAIHEYVARGTYQISVNVYDKEGRLLLSETSFILEDQTFASYAGVAITGPNAQSLSDYWASISLNFRPTTKVGFLYETSTSNYGTCYTNGIEYFYYDSITETYGSGDKYAYVPLYNCTALEQNFN